jgi:hypothetical protein
MAINLPLREFFFAIAQIIYELSGLAQRMHLLLSITKEETYGYI